MTKLEELKKHLGSLGLPQVVDFPDDITLCTMITRYGTTPAMMELNSTPLFEPMLYGNLILKEAGKYDRPNDILEFPEKRPIRELIRRVKRLDVEGIHIDVAVKQVVISKWNKLKEGKVSLSDIDKLKSHLESLGMGEKLTPFPKTPVLRKMLKALGTAPTLDELKGYDSKLVERVEIVGKMSALVRQIEIKWNTKLKSNPTTQRARLAKLVIDPEGMLADLDKEAMKSIAADAEIKGFKYAYGNKLTLAKLKKCALGAWHPDEVVKVAGQQASDAKHVLHIEKLIRKETGSVTVTFDVSVYKTLLAVAKSDPSSLESTIKEKVKKTLDSLKGTGGFFGGDLDDVLNKFNNRFGNLFDKNLKKEEVKDKTVPKSRVPLTMPAIHKALDKKVIGQSSAKRAIAHSVYVLSLLSQQITKSSKTRAVEVPNILLRGPSGCGKTLIASQIAKLLRWKLVRIDCSQITASGYYGDSLSQKLGDIDGKVVFLDEIDKLIGGAEDKSTKASTESVQYELLTYLEKQYSNVNCLFVAAGSFVNTKGDLIPELKGRLPVVCHLAKPTKDDFVKGFKTYHLPKLKAMASLVAPDKSITFGDDMDEMVGHLAYTVAENTPVGYRALDSFTHEISIQLTHDLSVDKDIVVNAEYIATIFKD